MEFNKWPEIETKLDFNKNKIKYKIDKLNGNNYNNLDVDTNDYNKLNIDTNDYNKLNIDTNNGNIKCFITEKLDGANASYLFNFDSVNNIWTIKCCKRSAITSILGIYDPITQEFNKNDNTDIFMGGALLKLGAKYIESFIFLIKKLSDTCTLLGFQLYGELIGGYYVLDELEFNNYKIYQVKHNDQNIKLHTSGDKTIDDNAKLCNQPVLHVIKRYNKNGIKKVAFKYEDATTIINRVSYAPFNDFLAFGLLVKYKDDNCEHTNFVHVEYFYNLMSLCKIKTVPLIGTCNFDNYIEYSEQTYDKTSLIPLYYNLPNPSDNIIREGNIITVCNQSTIFKHNDHHNLLVDYSKYNLRIKMKNKIFIENEKPHIPQNKINKKSNINVIDLFKPYVNYNRITTAISKIGLDINENIQQYTNEILEDSIHDATKEGDINKVYTSLNDIAKKN